MIKYSLSNVTTPTHAHTHSHTPETVEKMFFKVTQIGPMLCTALPCRESITRKKSQSYGHFP